MDPVDAQEKEKYYGFYRAKVVKNRDEEKYGRVMVWIPDIMPMVSDQDGIWARPGNNPAGGRNIEDAEDNYYAGTSYIPKAGSWLWIFFECGNINRPYYFGALDIENTFTLPEVQQGKNFEKKWVIFKSHKGRTVVISDDDNDARVEITGKKRKIKKPPTGDWDSVYEINGNQTTILLDEVDGREKLLIKTYLGDYIHIDIDERQLQCFFLNDIKIQTGGNLHLKVAKNIRIESGENTYLTVKGDTQHITTNFYSTSNNSTHFISSVGDYITAGSVISRQTAGEYALDSGIANKEMGTSVPAIEALDANPITPIGNRDT